MGLLNRRHKEAEVEQKPPNLASDLQGPAVTSNVLEALDNDDDTGRVYVTGWRLALIEAGILFTIFVVSVTKTNVEQTLLTNLFSRRHSTWYDTRQHLKLCSADLQRRQLLRLYSQKCTCRISSLETTVAHENRSTDEFQSLDDASWYSTTILVTVASFQSFWGKTYQYFSIKLTYLASIFVFVIGSLICGTSK